MKKSIKVKKYSGESVDFERTKLIESLMKSGADSALANQIADEVEKRLFEGISTKKIYQIAYNRLKKRQRTSATRYKIKKAIMELGPSGFPFEQFHHAVGLAELDPPYILFHVPPIPFASRGNRRPGRSRRPPRRVLNAISAAFGSRTV